MLPKQDLTQLLLDWRNGDAEAYNRLIPLVYDELRKIARRIVADQRSDLRHTLQPTAIVHEAYSRLIHESEIEWQSRAHFYGIAGRTIRRIIVDEFRKNNAEKRGGEWEQVSLDGVQAAVKLPDVNLLALDRALEKLESLDERKSRITELRFFSGLTNLEIGEVLGISDKTVEREWSGAKAWLHRELTRETL
ncbi:MAG: sigma-70 family RNA polymerase sigma factor [Blastocatellia bacterium]|nr:sigma-70 family RNA polymerase sigma factor [Blastocatellia bacterium]